MYHDDFCRRVFCVWKMDKDYIFLLELLTVRTSDLNLITTYNYITFNKPFPSIILGTISCSVMKILLFSSNYDLTQLTQGNGLEVTRTNPLFTANFNETVRN